ncbi:hypothetical protein A4X13_0g9598, partial [Tilletia indica]
PESQRRRTSWMARANGDGWTQGSAPSVGAARRRSTTSRERTSLRTDGRRLCAGGSRMKVGNPSETAQSPCFKMQDELDGKNGR